MGTTIKGDLVQGAGTHVDQRSLIRDNVASITGIAGTTTPKGTVLTTDGTIVALPGDLVKDSGLESAVIISLFTDKRAGKEDTLPDENGSRRGWWGDQVIPDIEGDEIGSHLWLLERSKTTDSVLAQAKQYAKEALQWMLDDNVVSRIEIEVERNNNLPSDRLFFRVELYKAYNNKEALLFEGNWGLQIV